MRLYIYIVWIDDSVLIERSLERLDSDSSIEMVTLYWNIESYTVNVYRELQVFYREIGLQGSHIYRDLSCVILLVIIRLILYKIKGIIGKS